MVTKVVINNNVDTPIEYLSGLAAFRNGKTYEFKPGVNIIVGKNGCGKTTLMNLIRKYLLDGDGMVRWEHETAYGYRYKMTLYASCNYLEFDVIRLSDHKNVYGLHHEYRQWEQAVKVFEQTKADILDPGNPAHTSIQQLAEKYYPINNE